MDINKEIINEKISNILGQEELQQSIHQNLNELIIQGKETHVIKLLNFHNISFLYMWSSSIKIT